MHGTTFGGGPLACAVALQLIAILEKEKLLNHVNKTGSYLIEQLEKLQKKHTAIREVRGMGLMVGVELESADLAKAVFTQLLKQGTIVNRTDETVIRLLPPFIVKKQHIDAALRQFSDALTKNTMPSYVAAAGRNK
jgi:acetylornithine/N-succinyldiaminopimelate aminotransferase